VRWRCVDRELNRPDRAATLIAHAVSRTVRLRPLYKQLARFHGGAPTIMRASLAMGIIGAARS
jgi:hypothetical protein